MSSLELTTQQRCRLQRQLAQADDVHLYRRTLAVLEYGRGQPVTAIAAMLGVTRQSVHNWVAAYARDRDPAALADKGWEGRPPLLTSDDEGWLQLLLAHAPQYLGYPATNWTVPLLREALQHDLGRRPSDDTIRRALRRLRYVWKQPRYVLEPDPEREKKTADSAADTDPASAQCRAGRRRDRPALVPAAARGVVAAG